MDNLVKALFAIADELKKIRRTLDKQENSISYIAMTNDGIKVEYNREEEDKCQ